MIPKSITSIDEHAFSGCSTLENIAIPESVTSIGKDAFSGCRSLTSIAIPKHITNLDSLGLAEREKLADADGGIIVNHVYIRYCGKAVRVVIPNGVTRIENSALQGRRSINHVTIPESVTSIGSRAFRDCHTLASVSIPASVTEIGDDAFKICPVLTIRTPAGSYAAEYAAKNRIPVKTE